MKIFTANYLFSEITGTLVQAGLADDRFKTEHYILFQRTLKPDPQDINLGHDKPHFEIDDQAHSGYGGEALIALYESRLAVKLHHAVAKCGNQ